jgi:hypothetical protein
MHSIDNNNIRVNLPHPLRPTLQVRLNSIAFLPCDPRMFPTESNLLALPSILILPISLKISRILDAGKPRSESARILDAGKPRSEIAYVPGNSNTILLFSIVICRTMKIIRKYKIVYSKILLGSIGAAMITESPILQESIINFMNFFSPLHIVMCCHVVNQSLEYFFLTLYPAGSALCHDPVDPFWQEIVQL